MDAAVRADCQKNERNYAMKKEYTSPEVVFVSFDVAEELLEPGGDPSVIDVPDD